MKWQDASQKLPSVCKRIGIIVALLFAVTAATFWILNSLHIIQGEWSTVMPIVFTALAAVFGFWQALLAKEQVRLALSQLFSSLFSEKTREPLEPPPLHQEERPPIWNIPYLSNPIFTGREDLLHNLHDHHNPGQRYALTGLQGIGKTQIALEYAYRYRGDYNAILWVRATTRDTLGIDFRKLASLLKLPEKDAREQNIVVAAVWRWLEEHSDWLLILDDANDLELAHDYLPTGAMGHILLTTSSHAVGTLAHAVEVDKMKQNEGVLFLLHRSKTVRAKEEWEQQ